MESIDGMDNHKAEGLLKLFKKLLGDTQNWTPESVQRKLNLKSKNVVKSKQKNIRGFDSLIEEERFENALKNAESFICCVHTKNIAASDRDQESDIHHFLEYDYEDHYIWCCARSCPNPTRFAAKDYSEDFIQIPDLNFGNDRKNQLTAQCPIRDVLVVLLMDDNYKVSILYEDKSFKLIKQRWHVLTPKNPKFFKKTNKNKENRDPMEPGPSGLNSRSRPDSQSSSSAPFNSSQLNDSGITGRSFGQNEQSQNVPSETVPSENDSSQNVPSQTAKSKTSSQTARSRLSFEKENNRKDSSDEIEIDDDDSKKIVFRKQYAEITSKGITQKIQIASKKDYPELFLQVGFQIENN